MIIKVMTWSIEIGQNSIRSDWINQPSMWKLFSIIQLNIN